MNYNTLAPIIMGDNLHKEFETAFGIVTFIHHNPYRDCLWVRMHKFQGAKVDVNTYLTASKLKNYGLMMVVRKKANNIGPKQKEYQAIEKVMGFIIDKYDLNEFDKNKYYK
ncbi:MAG: hypothetical protein ACI9LG_002869 [Moritella dasanensis]|jgi:hypothetical protein